MFCLTCQHGQFQQSDVQCQMLSYRNRLRKPFQEHQMRIVATMLQVVPVTSGGIVYYLNPSARPNLLGGAIPLKVSSAAPMSVGEHEDEVVPAVSIATPRTEPTAFTAQDLAQLLASSGKDHLCEWKLALYNPLQWHEWFGQFKSTIDSAPLTNDVKLTYLKVLLTGKAKTAIAEFAYCGTMYKDALKTLERMFGQPEAILSAYVDKLSNFPPLKMHNSESVISYSATISALVGVFRFLYYHQNLSSASRLGQATHKLPINLKEAWSMHTVKKNLDRPTLLEFNDWLRDKAEAHERMKISSGKPKTKDSNAPTNVTRRQTVTKYFASTSFSQTPSMGDKNQSTHWLYCL